MAPVTCGHTELCNGPASASSCPWCTTQHVTLWGPCRLLRVTLSWHESPKALALGSSSPPEQFGDPSPRYNTPGSLGGSSGRAPWLGGYSLWAGVQGAMNSVWAQHKDPGGHRWGYHAPHNCLLLARQDADAGSPTSADTAAAARALPALAASLCWSLGRRAVAGQGSAARGIWNHSPHGASLLNPNREDKKYFSTQQTPSTCKC